MHYIICDRAVADAATALIGAHGGDAQDRAADLAQASRERGNVHKFCHWRQVARMIDALSPGGSVTTLH